MKLVGFAQQEGGKRWEGRKGGREGEGYERIKIP